MRRSPEVFQNTTEFRPELAPERDLCLQSLLAQASAKVNGGYDREADAYLIEGINQAIVKADDARGEYQLACQMPGCEAKCVMVLRKAGAEGGLTVTDPNSFDACLFEQ